VRCDYSAVKSRLVGYGKVSIVAQDRMVTLSDTAGIYETNCSKLFTSALDTCQNFSHAVEDSEDTSRRFTTLMSRDDRTCLDLERDNIQNVKRLH